MGKVVVSLGVFLVAVLIPVTSTNSNPARALSQSTNRFALHLYQALRNSSENIIVSPISVEIVLALAQAGARGNTANEIARVLNFPGDKKEVLEGHKALIAGLEDRNLRLATRMFIENSFNLLPEFQNVASQYFLSDVKGEDFKHKPEASRNEINKWVEEKTNNKIKNLLSEDSITPDTMLVLVNAVHFKAKWAKEFDKELTREQPFYVTPEKTVSVPMMETSETFRYMESPKLNAKILQIPYAGNNFSMMIFLPNKVDGLHELENKLTNLDYADELSSLYETTVRLILPKFKLEQTIELNEVLKQMGIHTAFSGTADFSGISNVPLAISKVVQKAFIEVNEEGTEAAAATDVGFVFTSAIVSETPTFRCDRPFLFHLYHQPSKVILFSSRVHTF